MPKVKYDQQDSGAEEVEAFGVAFKHGKAVDVDDDVAARLKGNRFFSVAGEKDDSEPKQTAKPAAKKSDDDPNALKAVHIAGGRFVIKKGEEVVKEGLNKAEAHTFNDLSDDDKAEYVK